MQVSLVAYCEEALVVEAGRKHKLGNRPGPEVMGPPEFGSYLQCLQLLVKVSVSFCSFFRFMMVFI